MIREDLLEPIISSIRAGTVLSRWTILDYLADWEVLPGYVQGEHAWTMVAKGTEVHFARAHAWRPRPGMRGAVREFLRPKFDRLGFLTTRVQHGRISQKTFIERVGFKPTWTDAAVGYYLLANLPFERKT